MYCVGVVNHIGGAGQRAPNFEDSVVFTVTDVPATMTVTTPGEPDGKCKDLVEYSQKIAVTLHELSAKLRGETGDLVESLRVANLNGDWRSAQSIGSRDKTLDTETSDSWTAVGTYQGRLNADPDMTDACT